MPVANANPTLSNKRHIILTRTFNAPREMVFNAWVDPTQMAKWWGPHCFTNPECKMDVRPGGKIFIRMRGPDGTDYPMGGHFIEIKPPEKLVFVAIAQDESGNPLLESHTTVTFESLGKKTKLIVEANAVGIAPVAPQMLAGMEIGWSQSLEKLDHLISDNSNREMVITRMLNFPRELVFEAYTDPKHLINWWGPKGFTNTFHSIDVKPGGEWNFIMHGPDGTNYDNYVVFHEIVKPERIACAHGTKPGEPFEFYSTITFEDVGGKTKLTLRALFNTIEQYEAAKKFGAIEGGESGLDKLEEYLATMA